MKAKQVGKAAASAKTRKGSWIVYEAVTGAVEAQQQWDWEQMRLADGAEGMEGTRKRFVGGRWREESQVKEPAFCE